MFFLRETSPMGAEPARERAGFIARMPVAQSSASKTPRVKLLQDGLAQDVEIAFGGPGALDHSHENDFVGDIPVATCKPKVHARLRTRQRECDWAIAAAVTMGTCGRS
jgi:hypothetical protein